MFLALNTDPEERINTLHPKWRGLEEELRAMAREDHVVCPECEQLLNFRYREHDGIFQKRPHFAHRVFSDCKMDKQSAEVWEAKALLYEWLLEELPDEVEMNVDLQIEGWEHPADLYVPRGKNKPLACWVFRGRLLNRREFVDLYHEKNAPFVVEVIWTESALIFHDSISLKLTATQRDLIRTGEHDLPFGSGHLSFLDSTNGDLTIFRGINSIHPPHVFSWKSRQREPLAMAKVDCRSGEIVFQEDLDSLTEWQEEQRLERQRQLEERENFLDRQRASTTSEPKPSRLSSEYPNLSEPVNCERCGKLTILSISDAANKLTRICRECKSREG